ncbi:hypothetical protein B0H11DRAFT_1950889 [Mycena galericulata]|nr:hypothetical protein B0H11DRAFT_1950889 [Mycena galericulata]
MSTHLPESGTVTVNLNDLEDAGLFLRSLVKSWIPENRHLNTEFVKDYSNCTQLLRREPELYASLKAAAVTTDYQHIRDSPLLLRPNTLHARRFMDDVRSQIKDYVEGCPSFPLWKPRLEDDNFHSRLLDLGLFGSGDEPSLLLEGLGRFHDDPVLRDRLRSIFIQGKDTFLVNTSGSGKTRLTFEGLCQEWGFYFSAADNASGYAPQELDDIVRNRIPEHPNFTSELFLSTDSEDFQEKLKVNRSIAAHHFDAALLARLWMFQVFAEIMHETGPTPEDKIRWLLFQLRPRIAGAWDGMAHLTHLLLKDDHPYIKENIAEAIAKVRDIFGGDLHLFFVLDEAQATTTSLCSAFSTGGQLHPILPELMRAWQGHTADNFRISMVISGTDIPKAIFECEGNADTRHRWSSNTGAFDEPAQRRYIERFLPPTIAESQTGERLISRAWNWLRGRHRFTSAFVTMLLLNGFLPSDAILDDYFNNFTHIPPLDSDTDMYCIESTLKVVAFKRYKILDFSILATNPPMKDTIYQVLFHYLTTNKHPKPFGAEGIDLVSDGLGRFSDMEASQVVVDEPMVLVAAANWLLRSSESRDGDPSYYYPILHRDPPPDNKSLAKCVAYYLAHTFDHKRRLCDVFRFPGSCPKWATKNARLAVIHSDDGRTTVSCPETFPTLATVADSMTETVSWLQHREQTPFCISSRKSSPDLMFILQLADGTFIWVFLQAVVSTDNNLESILVNLQDANLFSAEDDEKLRDTARDALKTLPNKSSKLGSFGVLRVVASFPAHPCIGRLPLKTTQNAAGLNMGLFKRINEAIPAIDMVNEMAASVAGLPSSKRKAELDGGEHQTKRHRSTPTSTPTPVPEPPVRRATRSTKKKK